MNAGKGKIRNEWRLKRERLRRAVVKDFLILMGLMSLVTVRYQRGFSFPVTFIKDKKTQKSVQQLKTFGL